MTQKIKIIIDQNLHVLSDRAERLTPRGRPEQLDPITSAIHFLRGVKSRATMALPAFYLFLGARSGEQQNCIIEGYPGIVLKHVIEFSSIGTVTLSCRKIFDHGSKGLTGGVFAKCSDETLRGVAEYWARNSDRSIEDVFAAINLLRLIFKNCAQTSSALLKAEPSLCKRIGLLKQHADHAAAHLTSEHYEFSALDCAHVVAVLTIIGEIIRSFDDPQTQPSYFDEVDIASCNAARQLFPSNFNRRLFDSIKIEIQARHCWQLGAERGRRMLLEQLPFAHDWLLWNF